MERLRWRREYGSGGGPSLVSIGSAIWTVDRTQDGVAGFLLYSKETECQPAVMMAGGLGRIVKKSYTGESTRISRRLVMFV